MLRPLARSRLFVLCFCPKPSQVDACETVDLEFLGLDCTETLRVVLIIEENCSRDLRPSFCIAFPGSADNVRGKVKVTCGWRTEALSLLPRPGCSQAVPTENGCPASCKVPRGWNSWFSMHKYLWLCVPQALNCRLCLKICGTGSQIITSYTKHFLWTRFSCC